MSLRPIGKFFYVLADAYDQRSQLARQKRTIQFRKPHRRWRKRVLRALECDGLGWSRTMSNRNNQNDSERFRVRPGAPKQRGQPTGSGPTGPLVCDRGLASAGIFPRGGSYRSAAVGRRRG